MEFDDRPEDFFAALVKCLRDFFDFVRRGNGDMFFAGDTDGKLDSALPRGGLTGVVLVAEDTMVGRSSARVLADDVKAGWV